ncbi:MAG: HK97 family phage prohead protease [Rickettsiaceae bacterium]
MNRGWASPEFCIKSSKADHTIIIGYASVFGVIDDHNDIINQGAFKLAKAHDIRLLWQHDSATPIGIINHLEEDEYGLKIEAEINTKTIAGAEATALIKQGAVCGLSIGYQTKAPMRYNKQGVKIIDELELKEISIVTFPANASALISHIKQKHLEDQDFCNHSVQELESLIKQLENH